ncbi:MAG: ATPase, T2SS/T4P/T4SS family [Ruminococcus sp.]
MEQQGIQNVLRCLPQQVRSRIQQLTPSEQAQIQEIRLRAEIAEGFVTIAGGNRVGIAGSAVYREGKLVQMRHISGLNFRVSHAVTGCAEPLFRQICPERPSSLLLAGAVGSGKTTMLRDLCRLLGASWRLTLVDERSEIAAVHHGVPQYDVGLHTDVLDGFPRAEGLLTALRVLTPEVLVCDEISTEADAQAILRIHGSGVPVVASAHGTSLEDLERRLALKQLLDKGVFRYAAVLSGREQERCRRCAGWCHDETVDCCWWLLRRRDRRDAGDASAQTHRT